MLFINSDQIKIMTGKNNYLLCSNFLEEIVHQFPEFLKYQSQENIKKCLSEAIQRIENESFGNAASRVFLFAAVCLQKEERILDIVESILRSDIEDDHKILLMIEAIPSTNLGRFFP